MNVSDSWHEDRRPGRRTSGGTELSARILVVDDHADAAAAIGEWLTQLGHTVAITHDAHAALEVAALFRPGVALLDLRMPHIDGYELARRLRALLGERIRLVAVTGSDPATDRPRWVWAGFEAHMVKPVELADLQAVLNQR